MLYQEEVVEELTVEDLIITSLKKKHQVDLTFTIPPRFVPVRHLIIFKLKNHISYRCFSTPDEIDGVIREYFVSSSK
jgi:hypothetical protein